TFHHTTKKASKAHTATARHIPLTRIFLRFNIPPKRQESSIEPKAMFSLLKECGRFRRLRLRGLTGAKIKFGLKAPAHNLRKLALARAKLSFLLIFLSHKNAYQLYPDGLSAYCMKNDRLKTKAA
ncbi:MAG: hypothetical protein K2I90_01580, partial [Odoribacter sp.]|nr:hypothetical protein [Odoribacter sp.]